MSEEQHFDAHFQKAFGDFEPPVPAHIWENIAANKKKKKPVAFWWNSRVLLIAAVSGAIILAGVGWHLINNQAAETTQTETAVAPTLAAASSKQNSKNTDQATPSIEANHANKAPENVPATMANAIGDNVNTSSTTLAGTAGNNSPATSTNNIKSLPSNTTKPGKTPLATAQQNKFDEATISATDLAKSHKKQHPSRRLRVKKATVNLQSPGPDFVDDEGDNSNEGNSTPDVNLASTSAVPAEKLPFHLQTIQSMLSLHPVEMKPVAGPGCPEEKDAAGNKLYWEVYAGPDYAMKHYSDTGTSVLIQKRKSSLSFHSAVSAGARFTRVFSNGMSFRAGINYSRVLEKFTYLQASVVQINYEIDAITGDTTGQYYVRGSRYRNSFNSYRTLDIPITIGYELGNGRFHANINAGTVINLYSWQSGETLDTNYQPVAFQSGKENSPYQYKTNVGLGFTGAVSLYYKFTNRMHFMAEPYFRYNFAPVNEATLSIQEKYTTMGLRLGLRIDF
jgi:hypothetical protein